MATTNKISRWLTTIDEHLEKSFNSSLPEKAEEGCTNSSSSENSNNIRSRAVASTAITAPAAWTSTELTPIASYSFSEDNSVAVASKTKSDEYINNARTELIENTAIDSNDSEDVSSTDSWLSDGDDEQDSSIPIILNARHSTWGNDNITSELTAATNCHGVFHVRLIKAIRLPDILNTTIVNNTYDIQAILALPPWKGNIRSSRAKTRTTVRDAIRVDWHQQEQQTTYSYSMVHNFNNEETPIPQLVIDLVLYSTNNLATAAAALLLGTTSTTASTSIFETYLCSFTISCLPIMLSPGQYIKRWFVAATSEDEPENTAQAETKREVDFYKMLEPLILLELCFEPSSPFSQHVMPSPAAFAPPTCRREPEKQQQEENEVGKDNIDSDKITPPITSYSAHPHHLFRIKKFWVPAHCAVCSSLLISRKAYRCEACKLDCCADCLISVEILYPCGSKVTNIAVHQSLQSKLELRNILEVVAPTITTSERQKLGKVPNDNNGIKSNEVFDWHHQGIGVLKFRINRAMIFQKLYPPESFLEDIVENDTMVADTTDYADDSHTKKVGAFVHSTSDKGDYYVRISWNRGNESVRTRTIYQTSKPVFGSDEFELSVPNYGTEYKIEVVDANNECPVGCVLLSTQMMLLWQYDKFLSTADDEDNKTMQLLRRLADARKFKVDYIKCRLELRTGVRTGFGLDFYNSTSSKSRIYDMDVNKSKPVDIRNENRPGSISGFIDIEVAMKEDLETLMYSKSSRVCASRPPEDLNIELIQLHLTRIGNLLDGIKSFFNHLAYLVSWKDPALTGLYMIAFCFSCIKFNVEYIGSLPFCFLLIYMLYQYTLRQQGNNKGFWVNKERDARIEAEKKLAASVSVHRSVALLSLIVERGKNIRSRELGLPGSLNASVTWSPYHFLSPREVNHLNHYEATTPFQVGTTTSSGVTSNPVWRGITPSDEALRLRQLFYVSKPNAREISLHFDQEWGESSSFFLPILQPVTLSLKHLDDDSSPQLALNVLPWEKSSGAIIIQVRFDNFLNKLLVLEDVIGVVEIPLYLLLNAETNKNGEKIINSWFPLKHIEDGKSMNGIEALFDSHDEKPEIFVRARLYLPQTPALLNSSDREMSTIVAESMIRSSVLSTGSKASVIGSGINTINTFGSLISNIQMMQNQLGHLLDFLESALNAFTWVHPHRSFVMFILVFVAFLALSIIPTRLLIFSGGIVPFVVNFLSVFGGHSKESKQGYSELGTSPLVALAINFLNALPTNEDLRRAYFWEGRRIGERERQQLAMSKRIGRLTRLWNARWFGTLKIKKQLDDRKSDRKWKWESVFVLVQSHRILWWIDERHFDEAEPPIGFLMLSGHAGLGSLSPIDAKEFQGDEIERAVHIFGRGRSGQQKVCFLAIDGDEKKVVHDAIVQATEDD